MPTLSIENYDEVLDALDNENIDELKHLFKKYELEPLVELFDSPRLDYMDNELYIYMDYAITYNLRNVIDLFIDDFNLEINDEIMSRCLILNNLDTYKYLIDLGYFPEDETLKTAVKLCYAEVVDTILDYDKDLINTIDENVIELMYNINISEETIETVRVLINYGANPSIFTNFAIMLKNYIESLHNNSSSNGNSSNSCSSNMESHIIDELIDIFESNFVITK